MDKPMNPETFDHEPKPIVPGLKKQPKRQNPKKLVPRHDAPARRVKVRYVVPLELLNDVHGFDRAIRQKFVDDCKANKLEVNESTIHHDRENRRDAKRNAETLPDDHVGVVVKAWAKPLPGA